MYIQCTYSIIITTPKVIHIYWVNLAYSTVIWMKNFEKSILKWYKKQHSKKKKTFWGSFFLLLPIQNDKQVQNGVHLPIFDLPSMLIFTSWGINDGLGRVKGGSSSCFSTLRPSGADHLRFRPVGLLIDSDSEDVGILEAPFSAEPSSPFSLLAGELTPPCLPHCVSPFSCSMCRAALRVPPEGALKGGLRGGPRLAASEICPWLFFKEPFFKFFRVREMQTSPTASLAQGSSSSWVVRSGQQDDHPWPNTKKGYSTSTSTFTWERGKQNREITVVVYTMQHVMN